ncbi:MAG TPA: hypothetical protein DFS52_18205 [Myxococcales bacterium]|jgi:hypothetical protein|nr:hypothetical protein [Myxococcales bacterium]
MDNQVPPPSLPPAESPPTRTDPFAVTSLVLGATGVFFAGCCFPLTLLLGLLAVVFGVVALSRISSSRAQGKGLAIAGIITGIAGPAIGLLVFLLGLVGGTVTEVLGGRGP